MKKDKQRVENEFFTDEKLLAFLDLESSEGESKDFHIIIKAYHNMLAEDFDRFLSIFTRHDRAINAMNIYGQTALDIIASHKKSVDYVKAMIKHGASHSKPSKTPPGL